MKKYACIGLMFVLAITFVFAENVTEVQTRQGYITLYELQDSLNALAAGGTLTNGLNITGTLDADVVDTEELDLQGVFTAVSTNGATTNVIVDADGELAVDPDLATETNRAQVAEGALGDRIDLETLEVVAGRGGAVSNSAITFDAAAERTNTYGGYLSILGLNVQSGLSSTAGGSGATALGAFCEASGAFAPTAFGYHTEASGANSTAGGFRAKAIHDGAFAMADGESADFYSTANNQVRMRFANGYDLTGGPISGDGSGLSNLSVFASVTIETASVSGTQATITVTCKDLGGNTLAAAKTFPFWFTTAAVSTTPSTNGIESWSYVAHGNVETYLNYTTCPQYIGTTHTDGTMDFLVTSENDGFTNRFVVEGPNGSYTNLVVTYTN